MTIIKTELSMRCRFASHAHARAAIFEYIESFYNRRRLHSSLGYKSPLNFESIHAIISPGQTCVA